MNTFTFSSWLRKFRHWSTSVNVSIVVTMDRSWVSECLTSCCVSSILESSQIKVKLWTRWNREGLVVRVRVRDFASYMFSHDQYRCFRVSVKNSNTIQNLIKIGGLRGVATLFTCEASQRDRNCCLWLCLSHWIREAGWAAFNRLLRFDLYERKSVACLSCQTVFFAWKLNLRWLYRIILLALSSILDDILYVWM